MRTAEMDCYSGSGTGLGAGNEDGSVLGTMPDQQNPASQGDVYGRGQGRGIGGDDERGRGLSDFDREDPEPPTWDDPAALAQYLEDSGLDEYWDEECPDEGECPDDDDARDQNEGEWA